MFSPGFKVCLSRWLSLVFLKTFSSRAKYKPSEILCVESLFSQTTEQMHVRQGTDECRFGPPALFDLSSLHICIVLPHFLMHSQPKNPPAEFILDPGLFCPLSECSSFRVDSCKKRLMCICLHSYFSQYMSWGQGRPAPTPLPLFEEASFACSKTSLPLNLPLSIV